ncbi:DNA-protecting protein DprA [Balneolaceae bacterium YR4-1]|uniref:DNA-protecting protein DprA n=2 Tax=Halalkalibaculum roseum TaxID=2709311 RepID=A0A6M1SVY8_9BACT|nr:DNA-protecting protein DprA [Halalkalibaculum roseum]
MQKVDHPQDIFRLNTQELISIDGIGPVVANAIQKFNNWDEVDKLLSQTEVCGASIISFRDNNYPALLKEIFDPPILLWVKGDPAILDLPGVAVIGTRRATSYGIRKAKEFTADLTAQHLTVVSGLAYGVDAIAHRTTIENGGKTVAVLGSGIDTIYPGKHKDLAKDIWESGGAVISEFPPGTKPDAGNFPVRNRIVSGLTLGTLVIESGLEGGSMITARSALDQNREVFAIPHSLDNENGRGCNAIIKRGWGKLVQHIDDILDELTVTRVREDQEPRIQKRNWEMAELDEVSGTICRVLHESTYPIHIDDLSEKLEMPTFRLLPKLLELEMMDCVRQIAGKKFELS